MTRLTGIEVAPSLLDGLARALGIEVLPLEWGRYPDGESRFRVDAEISGERILLLANLHQPDSRTLRVLLLADTLRDLGAAEIILVAPYLAYMRQDKRFNPGEGITSRYFAAILSRHVDRLVTVDPHLHRYERLDEIYSIPDKVLHAAPVLADWVVEHVKQPLLVGPDAESEQWVSQVAERAGAPFVVGEKIRRGDRSVQVQLPAMGAWQDCQPVLVDDIISSGRTMAEAGRALRAAGLLSPICLGVHAVFGEDDYRALAASVARIVTTDAIPHETNGPSIAALLADGLREWCREA